MKIQVYGLSALLGGPAWAPFALIQADQAAALMTWARLCERRPANSIRGYVLDGSVFAAATSAEPPLIDDLVAAGAQALPHTLPEETA